MAKYFTTFRYYIIWFFVKLVDLYQDLSRSKSKLHLPYIIPSIILFSSLSIWGLIHLLIHLIPIFYPPYFIRRIFYQILFCMSTNLTKEPLNLTRPRTTNLDKIQDPSFCFPSVIEVLSSSLELFASISHGIKYKVGREP